MYDAKAIWQQAKETLSKSFGSVVFDVWIKTLEAIKVTDNRLVLVAPTKSNKNLVETKYLNAIEEAIKKAHSQLEGVIILDSDNVDDEVIEEETKKVSSQLFNPRYTFDNFVVGKSNQFVFAACHSVAENPGARHNPLFIYGGTGLGKTHLMHAIGNYLNEHRPDLKIMYVTCENFTNDVVASIKTKQGNELREKYRTQDVLMVDDIQFLAKTVATQEEFFNTFNDLYTFNKQIVISSDRPPRELEPLEERLRSRFSGGMIADIQIPDLETRIAILQKKAQVESFNVSNEVLEYIAQKSQKNVREMEGLLSRVVFFASLTNRQADSVSLAEEALKDYIDRKTETTTPDEILKCVCSYYNVKAEDVIGKKKNKEFVEPRQVAMFLMYDCLGLPQSVIGDFFGGRDHTTVMYARDKITEAQQSNVRISNAIKDLNEMLFNR